MEVNTPSGITTWSIIKFTILTLVFTGLLVALFTVSSITEIGKNFPRYRCNPAMMPFASNFGYDTMENFNFCLNAIFKGKASEIFGPIYGLLGGFTAVISQMVNVTAGLRALFGNFLGGVNGFVRNVNDKIQGLMLSVKISAAKMMNLMGRVYGTMYAIIFMGTSAMTAGFNLGDNDLIKFLFEFCFAPETDVVLYDRTVKPIKDIQIGDRLLDVDGEPVYVTSTFIFDGTETPMVDLYGIIVSSEHYVQRYKTMIEAGKHPYAHPVVSRPILHCLNVTGHKMKIGSFIFADYDEHDDKATIKTVQTIAEKAVNSRHSKGSVEGYALGYNPNDFIVLKDNSLKKLNELKIGDKVFSSGKVLGIVYEHTSHICEIGTTFFAPATLIWHKDEWIRAGKVVTPIEKETIVINLITEGCSALHIYDKQRAVYGRDYREAPIPEMEEPYREILQA